MIERLKRLQNPSPAITRTVVRVCLGAGLVFFLWSNLGLSSWPVYAAEYISKPKEADFALYYRDARIVIEHGWRSLSNPAYFVEANRELGIYRPDPPGPSLYPPLQTAIIVPFALLPYSIAYPVWELVMLACLVLAAWLLAPRPVMGPKLTLFLAVIFTPIPFGLAHGQVILIIGAAIAGAWWLLQKDRQFAAGVLLTLILLKPNFAVLVPIALLAGGRWRAFAGFIAGVLAVTVAYVVTLPMDTLVAYVTRLESAARHANDWYTMWDATLASTHWPIVPALTALAVGWCLWVAYASRRLAQRDALAISAALIGSVLVAPYLHYQDLYALAIAAWLFLRFAATPWVLMFFAFGLMLINSEMLGYLSQVLTFEIVWVIGFTWMVIRRTQLPRPLAAPATVAA